MSQRAPNLLTVIADTAATLGSNVGWYFSQSQLLLVLGPEHAATIAADGFTRADVQRYVYEHARLPLHRLKQGGMWGIHDWPRWMQTANDHALLPVVPGPDDVYVMVAGGVRQALGRRPELLLLPRRQPEGRALAAVASRRATGSATTVTARRTPPAPRRRRPGSLAARLARTAIRAPRAVRLAVLGLLVLAVLATLNVAYQVARKPTELFGLVFAPAPRTPSETWRRYGAAFRAHATDLVRPELLAALAQAESQGIRWRARTGDGAGRGTPLPCTPRPRAPWDSSR